MMGSVSALEWIVRRGSCVHGETCTYHVYRTHPVYWEAVIGCRLGISSFGMGNLLSTSEDTAIHLADKEFQCPA